MAVNYNRLKKALKKGGPKAKQKYLDKGDPSFVYRDPDSYTNLQINKSMFQIRPEFLKGGNKGSLFFVAVVKSEDPNRGRRLKTKNPDVKPAYKVTIKFEDITFSDVETKEFNVPIKLSNGTTKWYKRPNFRRKRIRLKCQCFSGNTLVKTPQGNRKIKDLVGLDTFEVYSFDKKNNKMVVANGYNCENKGKQRLYQVVLDNGEKIECTGDHRFLLKNGDWVEAKNLKPDISLEPLYKHDNMVRGVCEWVSPSKYTKSEDSYVYIWLDPRKKGNFEYGGYSFEYEPFYVGKGTKNRATSIHGRNKFVSRKLNAIKNSGLEPIIITSSPYNSDVAMEKEKYLISIIGRLDKKEGPLCNHTDGGDGTYSMNSSSIKQMVETRKINGDCHRSSIRMKNNNPMKNNNIVAKCVKTQRDLGYYDKCHLNFKQHSKEVRLKMSLAKKGKISDNFKQIRKNNRCFKINDKFKEWIRLLNTNEKVVITEELANYIGYKSKRYLLDRLREFCSNNDSVAYMFDGKTREISVKKLDKFHNHRVKKVIKTEKFEDVYCFTVDGLGNFCVGGNDESGVVVENCADFRHRFEHQLNKKGGLFGPPRNYERKTPPYPIGYPKANVTGKLGFCKHIKSLHHFLVHYGYATDM